MIEDDWVFFSDYEDLSDIEPMVVNDPEVQFHDDMTELAQEMQLAFHISDVQGPQTKEAADGVYTSSFARPKVRPSCKSVLDDYLPNIEPAVEPSPTDVQGPNKGKAKLDGSGPSNAGVQPYGSEVQMDGTIQSEEEGEPEDLIPNEGGIQIGGPRRRRRRSDQPTQADLPQGWKIERYPRKNGKSKGTVDKVYVSPVGRKFRSWKKAKEVINNEQNQNQQQNNEQNQNQQQNNEQNQNQQQNNDQ